MDTGELSEGDASADISRYLASFNKEIEDEESDGGIDHDPDEDSVDAENLQEYLAENEFDCDIQIKEEPEDDYYSISQNPEQLVHETGNKKRDKSSNSRVEIIRLGAENLPSDDDMNELSDYEDGAAFMPEVEEELHIDDKRTLKMVAQFAEQATKKGLKSKNPYQTVTVVPSDTNPGELSYVLFVSEDGNGVEKISDIYNPSRFKNKLLNKHRGQTVHLSNRQLSFKQHRCKFCSYTSTKKYLLARHMRSHSEDRPHPCTVCQKAFKTIPSLQNHMNTHTGSRPHPCRECDSSFNTSGELVRHMRYKHTFEKPHKCTECGYASVELSKLKRHVRCHTGERPYQCPHCTYASPDTYKLKRHLRIHTGEKPYECDFCQAKFTQSNSLKTHRQIHTGDKPVFQCQMCPTTCGRKTDLRIHVEKLHSSDNPQYCKRCGKVFLDRYSYKLHIRSHEGEKCFKCDLCDYASTSHRHLDSHLLVHTDEKPFQCDECDMNFRQKQLLKRHKNLYHDPNYVRPEPREKKLSCEICLKAFRHKGNLLRHMALHDSNASDQEMLSKSDDDQDDEEDFDGATLTGDAEKGVVVFEVIQLPGNKGTDSGIQTLTIDGDSIALNGIDGENFSIIPSAPDVDDDLFSLQASDATVDDLENATMSTFRKENLSSFENQNLERNGSIGKLHGLKNKKGKR